MHPATSLGHRARNYALLRAHTVRRWRQDIITGKVQFQSYDFPAMELDHRQASRAADRAWGLIASQHTLSQLSSDIWDVVWERMQD
jgi:hypothetical protein